MNNWYKELSAVDVNDNIKEKNGMKYLSWLWAWSAQKKRNPISYSTIHETDDGKLV